MIIKISAKCSDLFNMEGPNGISYDGYVPEFFPEEHFGDYVQLDINTKTGQIVNWPKGLTDARVLKAFVSGR